MSRKRKKGEVEKIRPQFEPDRVLASVRVLLKVIPRMNEVEVRAALEFERDRPEKDQRELVISRLESRLRKILTEKALAAERAV